MPNIESKTTIKPLSNILAVYGKVKYVDRYSVIWEIGNRLFLTYNFLCTNNKKQYQ